VKKMIFLVRVKMIRVTKLELAEMIIRKGTNMEVVRMDGAGLLSLVIVSQQSDMFNFVFTCSSKRLEHQEVMSETELTTAFLDPDRIQVGMRTGASPIGLLGQVGALMTSSALESSTKNRFG
jgi:hypothetical protein